MMSIYDYLPSYPKEEIDYAILNLDSEFKYLLYMLFENEFCYNKEYYIYEVLIPKIIDIIEKRKKENNKKNDYLISKFGLIKINIYNVNHNLLDLARYYMDKIKNYQDLLNICSIKEIVIALLIKRLEIRYDYKLKDIIELFNININELKRIRMEIVPLLEEKRKVK